jgi:hypothetical protein
MSKDTAQLQIQLTDNEQPLKLVGDVAAINQFIEDIKYGIEYNGSRNPLVIWEANGTKTYINPTKVQAMWYEL